MSAHETRRVAEWMIHFRVQKRHSAHLSKAGLSKLDMIEDSHQVLLQWVQRYLRDDPIEFCLTTLDNNIGDLSYLVRLDATGQNSQLRIKDVDLWPQNVKQLWLTRHTVVDLYVSKRALENESVTFERFANELVSIIKSHFAATTGVSAWVHRVSSDNPTTTQFKIILLFMPTSQQVKELFDGSLASVTWMDMIVDSSPDGNVGVSRRLFDAADHARTATQLLFDEVLTHYAANEFYNVKRQHNEFLQVPWAAAQYVDDDTRIGAWVNAQRFKHNNAQYFWDKRLKLHVYNGTAPEWWPIQIGERKRLDQEIEAEGTDTLVYQPNAIVIKAI
jgi:hypothetical protein